MPSPTAEFSNGEETIGTQSAASTAATDRLMWAELDDPAQDGWHTEVFAGHATEQLSRLTDLLTGQRPVTSADLAPLVTENFAGGPLLPGGLKTVFQDKLIHVQRAQADPSRSQQRIGSEGLATQLRALLAPFDSAQNVRGKFKIFRVEQSGDGVTTRQFFSFFGAKPHGMVEQNATWEIRWNTTDSNESPRMSSISVEDFEMVQSSNNSRTLFADCTESVLAKNACYEGQLLRGLNHWLERGQQRRYFFGLGTPGIALADVNGDGLDDLYLCQEEGLPNRLFLHQPDGTVRDVSGEWGVDWLHDSRSALFFDWDNDGDQDLAVAVLGGVVLAENDNQERLQFRNVLVTGEDTMSLSAADYDSDGDLDLYVCNYNFDGPLDDERSAPIPAAAANFVYHDANNGGMNVLFRNEGAAQFTAVTTEVGLEVNNRRYSFASAWEDFDNDNDLDLYVANDYGRDNFFRNDGGRFKDIAELANIEDSASGMGITWADYNRDGWVDVFISNMWSAAGNRITHQPNFKANAPADVKKRIQRMARGNTLLENNRDGTFRHVSAKAAVEVGRWAWGTRFMDLNNDGWDDLIVANGMVTTSDPSDL